MWVPVCLFVDDTHPFNRHNSQHQLPKQTSDNNTATQQQQHPAPSCHTAGFPLRPLPHPSNLHAEPHLSLPKGLCEILQQTAEHSRVDRTANHRVRDYEYYYDNNIRQRANLTRIRSSSATASSPQQPLLPCNGFARCSSWVQPCACGRPAPSYRCPAWHTATATLSPTSAAR